MVNENSEDTSQEASARNAWVSVKAKPKPRIPVKPTNDRRVPPSNGKKVPKAKNLPKPPPKKQKKGKNAREQQKGQSKPQHNVQQRAQLPLKKPEVLLKASDFPSLSSAAASTKPQPTWILKKSQPVAVEPSQKAVSQSPKQEQTQKAASKQSKPKSKQKQQQPKQKQKRKGTAYQLRPNDFPSLSGDSFPSLSTAAETKPAKAKPTFKKPLPVPKVSSPNPKPSKKARNRFLFDCTSVDPSERAPNMTLLRLMQQGKMVVKKGRQRIRPRKKKFSPLKKKVLEERLRKWKALHVEDAAEGGTTSASATSSTVRLQGYVDPEEIEDDDEFEEICENLQDMAVRVGPVKRIFIPRDSNSDGVPAFCDFVDASHASAATECWNGLVLGGSELSAKMLIVADTEVPEDLETWKLWCASSTSEKSPSVGAEDIITEIALDNALTEDDFEDEECMEESLLDISAMAAKFGTLESHRVEREPAPCLVLSYKCGEREATEIAAKLSKKIVGGTLIAARVLSNSMDTRNAAVENVLILSNVLTDDDVEDAECLEESLNDLRELASQFGSIEKINANIEAREVRVSFSSVEEVKAAVSSFDGMVIGGIIVSASSPISVGNDEQSTNVIDSEEPERDDKKPMYSGDKLIPERFAECKRVPKIPNSGQPRTYAVLSNNETVKPPLSGMLSELMRLQRRAIEDKNAKARRRLVMGLREVARGIRARKVRMVVMANNLDDYGVLDDKLLEILELAKKEDVPMFFEFSKRALGNAIGKSIKIAVVGIQNCDGAHQEFKKLSALAPTLPPLDFAKKSEVEAT